jgi:hypothetical protein
MNKQTRKIGGGKVKLSTVSRREEPYSVPYNTLDLKDIRLFKQLYNDQKSINMRNIPFAIASETISNHFGNKISLKTYKELDSQMMTYLAKFNNMHEQLVIDTFTKLYVFLKNKIEEEESLTDMFEHLELKSDDISELFEKMTI